MPKKRGKIGLRYFAFSYSKIITGKEEIQYILYEDDAQKLYDYLVKKMNGMYTTRDEAKELVKMMEGK